MELTQTQEEKLQDLLKVLAIENNINIDNLEPDFINESFYQDVIFSIEAYLNDLKRLQNL